jgi:hypothetical protein
MADPIEDIIGDFRAFAAQQRDRLLTRGIEIGSYELSHLCMGLEHLGVVLGDNFDSLVETHKPVLTGQQFQGPDSTPDPVYILFERLHPREVLPTVTAGVFRAP